jgi:hypothetical protein
LGGRQARHGFWLSGGLGYGSVDGGSNGNARGGVTGNIEAGWTLSRRFLLGIGTNLWSKSEDVYLGEIRRIGMTIGSVDLQFRWYPSEMAGGFFVLGSWGIGLIRLSDDGADPTSLTHTGRAFRGGLGFDFRVARGVSITPFASGTAVRTERDGDHMAADVWQLGLGLTVH